MSKHCPVCWKEVIVDGCAFYHKNTKCVINKQKEISWVSPEEVFDTDIIQYGVLDNG